MIYHLVEDDVFKAYMQRLFESAHKYIIIYSSDTEEEEKTMAHVRHRNFTKFVTDTFPGWKLIEKIPNKYPQTENGSGGSGSHSDFFIYKSINQ